MLDRFHKIAEIVASFAIVASLIFVGIQLQQNTHAMRINAGQVMVSTWADTNHALVNNQDLANHLYGAMTINKPLPDDGDQLRLSFWFQNALRQGEFNYFNAQEGNLDERYWIQSRAALGQAMKRDAFQALWKANRFLFTETFQQEIDQLMTE